MKFLAVFTFLIYNLCLVELQTKVGSGTNGNLRVCVVEGRGAYKRVSRYCPVLDNERSGVECVIGTDRLDCLRRISKGTVDFGAFAPEDLVAAQWADVQVLAVNEIRTRADNAFASSVVAVVNRRILPATPTSVEATLRNTTLCHPVIEADDLHPLSDTLETYLESLVTRRSCEPELSMAENTIRNTAQFFRQACRAGPWVPDAVRDAELKQKYPSLCAACASKHCSDTDLYWGETGALACVAERAGDVAWAELRDVRAYFKNESANQFAFLCHDGSWQPLGDPAPCVWLDKPWPVIVAKTKAAAAVTTLMSSLHNSTQIVSKHWQGALAQLLHLHQALTAPLEPPQPPMDYLARAYGFREAYSQSGCVPSRHISLCTTSPIETSKCEWFAEAGAVFGVTPHVQCSRRSSVGECMASIMEGKDDVIVADSDWLVAGQRDFSVTPILHEATPIIEKTNTVVAYVRKDAKITKMADLRGKRAAFPRFDGVAFHSVMHYLKTKDGVSCGNIFSQYFSEICAPGVENYNVTQDTKNALTKNCYMENGTTVVGEMQALRALVEGKSDVAFISINTFRMYAAKLIPDAWAQNQVDIVKVCPEESGKYCFVSWSNIGHVYAAKNLTAMRRQELINVFKKLDNLFGQHKNALMFSMYGSFNHKLDVLFHNYTKTLSTNNMFNTRPYSEVPLNFEQILKMNETCISHVLKAEFANTNFAAKFVPTMLSVLCLYLSVLILS